MARSSFNSLTEASIFARLNSLIGTFCTIPNFTPSLRTGNESDLPALNERDTVLYSDLLLHHMGPKLADGIVQGHAGPDSFRTAPLWGIGSACSSCTMAERRTCSWPSKTTPVMTDNFVPKQML